MSAHLIGADVAKNTMNAQRYCRFVYALGYIPMAPHLYYPQFLSERNPDERAAGTRYGKQEITRCKQLWVFGINLTDGMLDEIVFATKKNIPVRWFTENMEELDGQHI
jgi:CxxC motif-containing protein